MVKLPEPLSVVTTHLYQRYEIHPQCAKKRRCIFCREPIRKDIEQPTQWAKLHSNDGCPPVNCCIRCLQEKGVIW